MKHSFARTNALVLALLLILIVLWVVPGESSAQTPTVAYVQYGWAGYNGNYSVYLSYSKYEESVCVANKDCTHRSRREPQL
ncbi:hypothetical protein Thermo_01214 [Thermoplasmatales archaeon]|nr:hypothetical protein Thermo_01214 [Thermoplasmatales archaeon]